MAAEDPLAAGKQQILEYATSLLPAHRGITGLRWGSPGSDGVALIAETIWGQGVVLRLTEASIRSYTRSVPFQTDIQALLREGLADL